MLSIVLKLKQGALGPLTLKSEVMATDDVQLALDLYQCEALQQAIVVCWELNSLNIHLVKRTISSYHTVLLTSAEYILL